MKPLFGQIVTSFWVWCASLGSSCKQWCLGDGGFTLSLHPVLLGVLAEQKKWRGRNTWVRMEVSKEERTSGDWRGKVHGVALVGDSFSNPGAYGRVMEFRVFEKNLGGTGLMYSHGLQMMGTL